MTELAAALLDYIEKAREELKADPEGYRKRTAQHKAEALDKVLAKLNKLGELLSAIEDPAEREAVEAAGGYELVKKTLTEENDYYSAVYASLTTELPEIDIEAIKAEQEAAEREGWLPGLSYLDYEDLKQRAKHGDKEAIKELQSLRLPDEEQELLEEAEKTKEEQKQINKELLNVLADGKGEEAEALLLTATLADYEAAGITLRSWQRDIILNGVAANIKEIIYGLLFTELLKLWRILTTKADDQEADGLLFETYSLTKPQKTAYSVSKVAQKLIDIEALGKEGAIVEVGGKKDIIDVRAIMKYDDDNITLLGRPLTEFDKTVHDGVAALYAAGNKAFTIHDLYRACNGLDIIRIDADTLAPYLESLELSITRRLRIDATEQINAYYKGKVKKVVYENYFLPLKAVTITMSNGETVKGFAFLDAPPLYEYSSNIRQIVSAPIKLLRASKTVRNTPEVATITSYLIKRIDGIKNPKNPLQPKIAYEAIFTAAGLDTSKLDRTQLKRKRDIVKARLDYFKLQGFIEDYTEYKTGRQAGGVEIVF